MANEAGNSYGDAGEALDLEFDSTYPRDTFTWPNDEQGLPIIPEYQEPDPWCLPTDQWSRPSTDQEPMLVDTTRYPASTISSDGRSRTCPQSQTEPTSSDGSQMPIEDSRLASCSVNEAPRLEGISENARGSSMPYGVAEPPSNPSVPRGSSLEVSHVHVSPVGIPQGAKNGLTSSHPANHNLRTILPKPRSQEPRPTGSAAAHSASQPSSSSGSVIPAPTAIGKGTKRKYNDQALEKTKRVRDIGACVRCRKQKKEVCLPIEEEASGLANHFGVF